MKKNWYLGKIVEFPIIKDKKTKRIINSNYQMYWINDILIKAKNSEEAYNKLIDYGKSGNYTFTNTNGNRVTWKFAGVNDLLLIHDELDDLAEIACYERIVRNTKNIFKLIPQKEKLTVFKWEESKKNREKGIDKTKITSNEKKLHSRDIVHKGKPKG